MAIVFSEDLFTSLAAERPKLVVKYMANLAEQIDGYLSDSARGQITNARIAHDDSRLGIATDRDRELRDKFMAVSKAFFAENFILGGIATNGESRAICDVIYQEQGHL